MTHTLVCTVQVSVSAKMKLSVLPKMVRVRAQLVGKDNSAKIHVMTVDGAMNVRCDVHVKMGTCATRSTENVLAFLVGWVTIVKSIARLVVLAQIALWSACVKMAHPVQPLTEPARALQAGKEDFVIGPVQRALSEKVVWESVDVKMTAFVIHWMDHAPAWLAGEASLATKNALTVCLESSVNLGARVCMPQIVVSSTVIARASQVGKAHHVTKYAIQIPMGQVACKVVNAIMGQFALDLMDHVRVQRAGLVGTVEGNVKTTDMV